jgi:hypothetical protein
VIGFVDPGRGIKNATANLNLAPVDSTSSKVQSPDKGWLGPARVRWFRMFAMKSRRYGDSESAEMKIELEKEAANLGG